MTLTAVPEQKPGITIENGTEAEDHFDPAVHLNYVPPSSILTMEDLGLKGTETSTKVAGSVPFALLSLEGVSAYRRSMMKPGILKACGSAYGAGTLILRNLACHSKFIRDLWSHPETNRIVSEVAGVPLTVIMPTEMGHTNIQTRGSTLEEMTSELEVEPSSKPVYNPGQNGEYNPLASKSVIPWHYDSYPYVAVLMLSDTTHMTGGETYIKKGDGSTAKVEGPALGYCAVLQGGQVEHLAARAFGTSERITTITSYRAAVDGIYDDSYISNIRPYSKFSELYTEWMNYRLEKLKNEISRMQTSLTTNLKHVDEDPSIFPSDELNHFTDRQISYLKRTVRQMVSPTLVREAAQRFDVRDINSAGKTWAGIRKHARFQEFLPAAMSQTMTWKPLLQYITDWHETKYLIENGHASSISSQQGRFSWDTQRVDDYLFGDELLRQGLKEVLVVWLDRTGLITLAASND